MTSNRNRTRRGNIIDRLARKLVQVGFLALFLYPLLVVIYKRITYQPGPTLTSWLFPWDPLLMVGEFFRQDWTLIIIGAPLMLIALSLVGGRFFCGWVCPLGTVLDLARSLVFWEKRKPRQPKVKMNSDKRNSPFRYFLLLAILLGGIFSFQILGIFDPLVIFTRTTAALTANLLSLKQAAVRISLSVLSLTFVSILVLEIWRPRFWCRNLCPLGALLSIFSRWSLLNRRVTLQCTNCGECSRVCSMNAIPQEAHDTDYSDCTFCLECEGACPKGGISFGLGGLAFRRWKRQPINASEGLTSRFAGEYMPADRKIRLTRRQFTGGLAAAAAGIVFKPLVDLAGKRKVIRPPGAIPEDEFLRKCIVCQECVRVCPTGGIRPVFLEAGLAGIGTPQLIARQGGCALNPSCPNLCARVCPVGALKITRPEELKLGIARVNRSLCLAWDQGVKCLVCVEACINNAAVAYHGRVTVDPLKCTGCGRCESGCPVAGSAIRVYPI